MLKPKNIGGSAGKFFLINSHTFQASPVNKIALIILGKIELPFLARHYNLLSIMIMETLSYNRNYTTFEWLIQQQICSVYFHSTLQDLVFNTSNLLLSFSPHLQKSGWMVIRWLGKFTIVSYPFSFSYCCYHQH